jgi:hypothetical protein
MGSSGGNREEDTWKSRVTGHRSPVTSQTLLPGRVEIEEAGHSGGVGTIPPVMGAVGTAAILFAFLALFISGFVWQSSRRSLATEPAEYLLDEAKRFVWERLSDRAMDRLDEELVRRILEWNLHYTQVIGPRDLGRPPVIGSGDGIEYVMERGRAAGFDLEPIDIAEIMTIEVDYLLEIGAIGIEVTGDPE